MQNNYSAFSISSDMKWGIYVFFMYIILYEKKKNVERECVIINLNLM